MRRPRIGRCLSLVLALAVAGVFAAGRADGQTPFPAEWQSLDAQGLAQLALTTGGLTTVRLLSGGRSGVYGQDEPVGRLRGAAIRRRRCQGGRRLQRVARSGDHPRPLYPGRRPVGDGQGVQGQPAPAADALNQVEPVQAVKICRVLERLGDGGSASSLAMAWLTGSDKYKTLPPVYVTYMCFATNASQNAEARQRLQDWIATDLLATPEKVRTAPPANWGTIINALTASLSPRARPGPQNYAGPTWTMRMSSRH